MRQLTEIKLEHIPVTGVKPLGMNAIGSHIWGMNHEGSDIDSMAVVQEPTKDILMGLDRFQTTSVFKSETDHNWPIDIHVHEVGRVVGMLEKGNINFVCGVGSPIPVYSTPEMEDLRRILTDNPHKGIYDSIHGMAIQNIHRFAGIPRNKLFVYSLSELQYTPIEPKRAAKMLAFLEFGIQYLDTGKMVFNKPVKFEWSTDGVLEAVKALEAAKAASGLPEDMKDSMLYRDWLLDIRLAEIP